VLAESDENWLRTEKEPDYEMSREHEWDGSAYDPLNYLRLPQ